MTKAPRYIAQIDSSSTVLRALANVLRGKDLPGLGLYPTSEALAKTANAMPANLRRFLYIVGGWREALKSRDIDHVQAEQMSQWVTGLYPRRSYPGVMIGSANGAAVYLSTALGMPWLPQTFLIPIGRSGGALHPDELKKDIAMTRESARRLLENNPDLQVNQMHDPVQDRLMVERMAYFRVKRIGLGETFTRFLETRLPRGATILVLDCQYQWPMAKLGDRHYFQLGGFGGISAQEYLKGGARVSRFLRAQHSPVRRWDPPKITGYRPEAEWGFEPALLEGIRKIARKRGYRIKRLIIKDPEDMSPMVADLYRWWYRQRGIPDNRLLAESFILLEPYWCLRTGSVPFWLTFNTLSSADRLEKYLNKTAPFDEIYMTLFANGVRGAGQVPLSRWRASLRRARKIGRFVGVDEKAFPSDLGIYLRYSLEVKKIAGRYPLPEPLDHKQFQRFLRQAPARYGVDWA